MARNTLEAIRMKVRRLTASPSQQQLSDADLDEYVNTYMLQDLPSSLKLRQLRDNYEFMTVPDQDEYALDANKYYEVEAPIYVAGYDMDLYVDQTQFYAVWSKAENSKAVATGDGTTGPYPFTLSPLRITKNSLTIACLDVNGDQQTVQDDGAGNLVDFGTSTNRGTVNYTTGAVSVTYPNSVGNGNDITAMWRSYQAGRPSSMLYFQNTLKVRPVPDKAYRVQVQVVRQPTSALVASPGTPNVPELNQWWQLIALGAAIKVLQDRQDVESIANIMPFYEEQKELALHRTISQLRQSRSPSIYADQADYQGAEGSRSGTGWYY